MPRLPLGLNLGIVQIADAPAGAAGNQFSAFDGTSHGRSIAWPIDFIPPRCPSSPPIGMDAEILFLAASSLPFSRDESTQWVVLAAGVIATIYVVMRSKSRAKRVDPLSRQPAAMGLAQQRQVERDISNLMVEMLETARQMTAQLDTRA